MKCMKHVTTNATHELKVMGSRFIMCEACALAAKLNGANPTALTDEPEARYPRTDRIRRLTAGMTRDYDKIKTWEVEYQQLEAEHKGLLLQLAAIDEG
jgi:hypothetical protein